MQQAPSQPIQQFVAKLRAKAEHCSFQLKCSSPNCNNTTNSYMASMVADQMTVGCYDKDIQGEVLAKHSQITTFDEKFDLIQALEDGKRAKQQLGSESSLAAQRSTYQRGRNRPKTPTPIGGKNAHKYSCSGCGSTDHGNGTDKSRKHHCPACREQCSNCLTKGHLATVCRSKPTVATVTQPTHSTQNHSTAAPPDMPQSWFFTQTTDEKEERAFISGLRRDNRQAWRTSDRSTLLRTRIPDRVILPNIEWVPNEGRFEPRRPRPLPKLRVKVDIMAEFPP